MTNANAAKPAARIMALVAGGMAVDAAYDAVMGAGSFKALADTLHSALNKGA